MNPPINNDINSRIVYDKIMFHVCILYLVDA